MTNVELTIYRELKPLHSENMAKHVSNVLVQIENNKVDTSRELYVRLEAIAYLVYVLKCRGRYAEAAEYDFLFEVVYQQSSIADAESRKAAYEEFMSEAAIKYAGQTVALGSEIYHFPPLSK